MASTRPSCTEFLRDRLARFKVPKSIEVVDELPKTGTGKIQKFVLRERARRPSGVLGYAVPRS